MPDLGAFESYPLQERPNDEYGAEQGDDYPEEAGGSCRSGVGEPAFTGYAPGHGLSGGEAGTGHVEVALRESGSGFDW